MNLKITLQYFDALFTTKSEYPHVSGCGNIVGDDPRFYAEFRIDKQPFNTNFKLLITKGTLFDKDATKAQDRELALQIKIQIKIQMMDMIKRKLERIYV